jgi:hypothetical protein
MTLTLLALYALLHGVVGPILIAVISFYQAPKGKVLQYSWQKIRDLAIGFLGASVALLIIKLFQGHDLYDALMTTWPYFSLSITVCPLAWFVITYVEGKRTKNGAAKA